MEVLNNVLETVRPETLGDMFIYAIFLLSLLNIAFIPEKNDLPLYLHYGVILLCILDLLWEGVPLPFDDLGVEFARFLVRLGLFLGPMLSAGAIRLPKGKRENNYARLIAILITFIGLMYAVGVFASPGTFEQVVITW